MATIMIHTTRLGKKQNLILKIMRFRPASIPVTGYTPLRQRKLKSWSLMTKRSNIYIMRSSAIDSAYLSPDFYKKHKFP